MTHPRRAGARGLRARAIVVVALAAITPGCATTVAGSAVRDAGFTPGEAIPALLQPGNYPTTPHKPYGTAGDGGAVFEGHRMAEFVVGPWEVDPTLTTGGLNQGIVYTTPKAFGLVAGDSAVPDIVAKHAFVVGFSSSRSTPPDAGPTRQLSNAVLRFATPDDAAAAATELGAPHGPPFPGAATPVPYPVPGHPEAVSTTMPLTDGSVAVSSYTARGPYVLYVWTQAPGGDVDGAGRLSAKTIDMQGPRIDGFAPTDPAKLADLPLDPSGLMARTLPPPKTATGLNYGTWGPRAALHFETDPVASAKMFAEAGVTVKTWGASLILEAKDAPSAQRLLQGFRDRSTTNKPTSGVPGLPSAKCSTSDGTDPMQPTVFCDYAVDRYVVAVASRQDVDAQQQAAAQYLVLTAK